VPLLVRLADLGDGLELVGAEGGGGHAASVSVGGIANGS
jgi:hypothetical protein